MNKNKRGQAWGIDLIVSVFIFVSAILLFYNYSTNLNQDSENINVMLEDGTAATNVILSEGYPAMWNKYDVEKPGIFTGSEVDRNKLQSFLELTSENYTKVKNMLGTKYDFYLFFQSNTISFVNSSIEGIGSQGVNSGNIETLKTKKIVKISRFVILDKKPAKMIFYLWEK